MLVTSALPYANGPLNLGHMVEYIQTDIFVRFQRSIGRTCHYVCADDAHGTPIMLSAQKQGVAPEDYIQTIYHEHRADFEQYHVQFDYYGQTHCEANRVRSEQFFQAATQAKAIYKKTIVQMYCAACSLFFQRKLVRWRSLRLLRMLSRTIRQHVRCLISDQAPGLRAPMLAAVVLCAAAQPAAQAQPRFLFGGLLGG